MKQDEQYQPRETTTTTIGCEKQHQTKTNQTDGQIQRNKNN